jgi:hypothetical protein
MDYDFDFATKRNESCSQSEVRVDMAAESNGTTDSIELFLLCRLQLFRRGGIAKACSDL